MVARREHRLLGISEQARRLGAPRVMIVAADVVKEDDCRRFINETINQYGRSTHHHLYLLSIIIHTIN